MSDIKNPFPNEHAARIKSPGLFETIVQLQKLPNGIRILGGPLKTDPEGSTKPQSYRFPRTKFSPSEARTWLSDHDIKFILFEDATGEKASYIEDNFAPQYIRNISRERAEINLFDDIGNGGISGQKFADEMQMLNEFGVKEIHININSPGGVIMDGLSIFAAITNSEAEVHTHIEVAISMAGVIAMAGDKITMVDHGKLMIHNPSGSSDPNEKEQNALDSLRDSLLIIFKNRTKVSKSRLSEIMDQETWLTPKEALEGGFIDEIISGRHKEKKKKRQPVAEITNLLNITNKTDDMKKLAKYFDLNEDASESAILDALKEIADKLTEAKSTLETKETELVKAEETIENQKTAIKSFEDKQTELNETLVDEAIETAIKDGKFEEKDKEELTEEFKNNLPGFKLIVGKLKTPAQIITNQLNGSSGNSVIPEDKKDWSLRKFEKEAPKLLEEIRTTNVDVYKELYKSEYNVEYTG